ncbi:MAG: mechanosensitive ion channel domain-containing protein [Roseobacter sp.]
MEKEEKSIVEQEVEVVAEAVTTRLRLILEWLQTNLFSFESIYQVAAIVLTLFLAWLMHRRFKSVLELLSRKTDLGPAFLRLIRTVAAISLPVVWAILLSGIIAAFEGFALPIQFLRLVFSLVLAFVVIRIVSIFIPSAYWSQVFAWVALLAAALNAVGVLDIVIEWLRATGFTVGDVSISAWTILKGIMLATLLLWGANALSGTVERQLQKSTKMSTALRLLIVRLLRLALIFLAVIVAIAAVGVDLTVFAIFSGALGVGLGLGLRRTVENLIASYTLLADESIKPGDVIEVETVSGPTYGQVSKMTTRYVAVRTRDGTETLIPNEILMANPLTNWSHSDKPTRRRVPVGISYDSDVELARSLCLEAAREIPRILTIPAPNCLMRGFGDSSIDLELRFWIDDPENGVANVASEVMLKIWHKFQNNGIEVPFPQQDLHVKTPLKIDQGPVADDQN